MLIIRNTAFPRMGLAGNPSDGYGGKTLSATFRNFCAQVVLYPWEQLEILGGREDKNRYDSIDELVADVNLQGYYGGVRLVKATIKKFGEFCRQQSLDLHARPFAVRYETNIPRGVGLSGSSAIVVATLKCLIEYYSVSIPQHVLPSLARAVENDELRIACGYQDRVVQVYTGLVYMDFSNMQTECGFACGRYEQIDASLLPPLYLAYDLSAAKVSGDVHGPLRANFDQRKSEVMSQIAALVPLARAAIVDHNSAKLNEVMNRNFDLRTELYNIRPIHLDMIRTARSVGLSAKFAGSGGAIVGICETDEAFERLKLAMQQRNSNWQVIRPIV